MTTTAPKPCAGFAEDWDNPRLPLPCCALAVRHAALTTCTWCRPSRETTNEPH